MAELNALRLRRAGGAAAPRDRYLRTKEAGGVVHG